MDHYTAPVQDWQFVLHDVLNIAQYAHLPGFADLSPELTDEILSTAARFHQEVVLPLNRAGDVQGARLENGQVRTPDGFPAAWKAYREAGWHRLALATELGGAGLPPLMLVPVSEMRISTGHSFSMYNSFCAPSARMLAALGPDWVRQHVVPRLSDGEWTATMCMTEPQAGTDLRQLRTRAVPQPDGSYRISGEKIFISGGDHDMTENIAHIVLAKVPDESGRLAPGLASVSVFLVPKRRINPQTGESGELNGVQVRALEHKMGIEGSATCAMSFENAEGWRISDERRSGSSANMAPMFLLMNYARVSTAMSGVGYGECALQLASAYARERLSGRAHGQPRRPDLPADPIIVHADVRRQLLDTRAFVEAARAGAMQAALWQSLAEHHPDPQQRQEAGDLLDLLTPVMKAYFTDSGFEAAVACQQVLGGHGYIRDHGIEQMVRNARIGQLYEGANGIQAVDLLRRKLTAHGGRAGQTFLGRIDALLARHAHRADLQDLLPPLAAARARLGQTLDWLAERVEREPEGADAGAYDLLTAMGIVYLGWIWVEQAACVGVASRPRFIGEQEALRKSHLARLWMQRQMPLVHGRCDRIQSGNAAMLAVPETMI